MLRTLTSVYFAIGFLLGILSVMLLSIKSIKNEYNQQCIKSDQIAKKRLENPLYDEWFAKTELKRKKLTFDELRYGDTNYFVESQLLYENVKVLCIILVKNEKNAKSANNTWATGCNQVYFVNSLNENKKMPVKKTKETSTWALLCKALLQVSIDFDWFLVVNDATFVILENLRLLVAGLDPNKGHYLGHAVSFWSTTYNSGPAGYVLSKGSILAFRDKFHTTSSCTASTTYLNQEDFYLGKVLSSLNIFPSDTRDSLGLTTFHSYNWQHEFFPRVNYYKFSIYPVVCCSAQSITFQATEADKMYMYYYLLYQLQVFKTGNLGNKSPPRTIPEEQVWQSFLKERGMENASVSPEQYYKIWEELVHDPTVFAREVAAHKYEYYDD